MNPRKLAEFALGPVLVAVAGAVTVPLIAWVFTPADVGRFAVLQTVTALAVTAAFLGLDQAYVREYHEVRSKVSIFATMMWPPIGLLAVVSAVVAVWPGWFAALLYGVDNPTLAWGTLGSVVVALLVRQWTLIVRMEERGMVFSVSQAIPKLAMVVGVLAIAAYLPRTFPVLLLLFVGTTALALVPLGAMTWRTWVAASPRRIVPHELDRLLRYSISLCVAALAYASLASVGTISLRLWSSFEELGLYSVALSVAGVAVVIQSIFSIVWAPILYRRVAEGTHPEIMDLVRERALAIITLAFACGGSFSWLLDYVLPPEYELVKYLVIGTIAQPLLYTLSEVTSAGIGVTRRSGFALAATVAAFVVAAGASLLLVPSLGASGAVISCVASFWLLFVVKTEASVRIWYGFRRVRMHLLIFIGVALSILSILFGAQAGGWVVGTWVVYGAISVALCGRTWARMLAGRP